VKKIVVKREAATLSHPFHLRPLAWIDDYNLSLYRSLGAVGDHTHVDQDELFFVQSGQLHLHSDWGSLVLEPGELAVVPKGVTHHSWSLLSTAVLLCRCDVLPDHKNGERRVFSFEGQDQLRKASISSEADYLEEPFVARDIAQVDDMHFRLVAIDGSTAGHVHQDHDELLMVYRGLLVVGSDQGPVLLHAGEMTLLPKGVGHRLGGTDTIVLSMTCSSIADEASPALPAE
jgi:mannose-6-phosphate isomerase-like protein (cupin superfamily)